MLKFQSPEVTPVLTDPQDLIQRVEKRRIFSFCEECNNFSDCHIRWINSLNQAAQVPF